MAFVYTFSHVSVNTIILISFKSEQINWKGGEATQLLCTISIRLSVL